MAAAMLASPAASLAAAQSSASSGSSGSSGSGQTGIAAESPANRAIAGGSQSAAMLRLGSTGRAVADVQRELGMEVDGIFGASTDQSVRVYQGNEDLAVDGIVGPQTWGALFGSGGGTGPAANVGGPDLDVGPAVANDRTPVGNRTQFAVRMAAETELDENERAGLRAAKAASPPESEDDGGLVAIEFRAPETSSESEATVDDDSVSSDDEGDSGSAASDSGSSDGADSDEERRAAPSAPKGEDGEDPDSGADKGKPEDEPENKPKPEPKEESKPRPDDGKGSGACSNKLLDPLRGKGTRTSDYGQRGGRLHAGVDISAPSGTPIRAAACGVVNFLKGTSSSGGYGNFICVKHSSSFTTCYAHLSKFSNERMGDRVKAGQLIGYVGSTGNSTGPHLHFETRTGAPYGDNSMNPDPYLEGRRFSCLLYTSPSPRD